MAGTYADQHTLASTQDFINLVKASLVKRVAEIKDTTDTNLATAEAALVTAQANLAAARKAAALNMQIVSGADGYAQRMAHIVATTNPTIGANAPAVPSEGDTQYAVNQSMGLLA